MDFKSIESISLYKQLLEGVSDAVIIYKKSGSILWCNRYASQILSKSGNDILGEDIKIYIPCISNENENNGIITLEKKGSLPKSFEVKREILKDGVHELNVVYLRNIAFFKPLEIKNKNKKPNNYEDNIIPYQNAKYRFEDIIGENKQLNDVKVLAQRAALSSSPILIYGDTGTGKELFAQSIHNASKRGKNRFVGINCAAVPDTLLEAIFFGTIKGAYTGAVDRPGLFELASDGTIFLDEINSMPLYLQAKLLRVIQEGNVRRLGGSDNITVNTRIISAINIEPFEAIRKKYLLNDLFYRIGVVCIRIPPLIERKDDLSILTNYFIKKICSKLGKKRKRISPAVLELFNKYSWPGNVRQLEYIIESSLTFIKDSEPEILLEHLPEYFRSTSIKTSRKKDLDAKSKVISLQEEINKIEKNKVIIALEEASGNISRAARQLNMSRQSLYYRMVKYGIMVSRYRSF